MSNQRILCMMKMCFFHNCLVAKGKHFFDEHTYIFITNISLVVVWLPVSPLHMLMDSSQPFNAVLLDKEFLNLRRVFASDSPREETTTLVSNMLSTERSQYCVLLQAINNVVCAYICDCVWVRVWSLSSWGCEIMHERDDFWFH